MRIYLYFGHLTTNIFTLDISILIGYLVYFCHIIFQGITTNQKKGETSIEPSDLSFKTLAKLLFTYWKYIIKSIYYHRKTQNNPSFQLCWTDNGAIPWEWRIRGGVWEEEDPMNTSWHEVRLGHPRRSDPRSRDSWIWNLQTQIWTRNQTPRCRNPEIMHNSSLY